VTDRDANLLEVFDVAGGARETTIALSGADSADPTPDLVDIGPSGNRVFIALRGPNPLSGDPHVSTGSTPGLMVIQVEEGGRRGIVKGIVRLANPDGAGIERADPHAVRVRRR
jgi:hypothetical protein